MRALLPGWPLQVRLGGEARWSPAGVHLALQAGAGAHAAGLDLEGTFEAAPAGAGGAASGALRHGRARLTAPGATVTAEGLASTARVELSGSVEAGDLSALPGFLEAVVGVALPALAGSGRLHVELRGPVDHLAATLEGALAGVQVGPVRAGRLELALAMPELRRPLALDARLEADAAAVAGQPLGDLTVVVATRASELRADLTVAGAPDGGVHLEGTLDADGQGATLQALRLTAPGVAWRLEAPARVSWAPGLVRLEPATVRDGDQRVSLAWSQEGAHVEAALHASAIDLARVPPSLLPQGLGLEGVLGLDVVAAGSWPWPEATLGLRWSEGALAGVRALEVTADGVWRASRLRGTLAVTSDLGALRADADLPLLGARALPLSASLQVSAVDLARLGLLLGAALPLEGEVSLEARAGGTALAPEVEAALTAPRLTVLAGGTRLALESPRLEVRTLDGGALHGEATAEGLGGAARVTVEAPFTLLALATRWPSLEELEAAPLALAAEATGLDLARLPQLGLDAPAGLSGRLALGATLSGTAAAPLGSLRLEVAGGALPPLRALDASLTLTAGPGVTSLEGEAHQGAAPVLTATASVAAAVRELRQPAGLGGRAASATVKVLPTELAALFEPPDGGPPPAGSLTAALELKGTLGAPALRLESAVEALELERVPLGRARLELLGDARAQRLDLRVEPPGGEGLSLAGTLGLPLGVPRAGDPAAWRDAPVALTLRARDVDLAFLSGLHPLVRAVGGQLTAHGVLSGTLGAPSLTGDAHWGEGSLALTGFGAYHAIELELAATPELVELSSLELEAGGGRASLHGRLERTGDGRYHLSAAGALAALPIIIDDQLLVTATLPFTVVGALTPGLLELAQVSSERVDLVLPDAKRKDLQDLERPADIVLLGPGGRPARLRLAAIQAAALAASPGPALRARLDLPRNVWLKGTDLDVELGLSEGFLVEAIPGLRLRGEAAVLQGAAAVIGRSFVVQPGSTVRFDGPPTLPLVDLAARYTNEREQVKVTVAVDGRGAGVSLHVSSEPPLPETDIYTLLATGRRQLRRGSGAALSAEEAVSVVGQLAATQLRSALARRLPIDVLGFESTGNFANLKFDVGKYLSDWLYLGVSVQTGANPLHGENPWAGRLELRLAKQWTLEAYGGTAPAAGLDVVWSKDF
jgi:translocation and assembly module TamB